MSKTYINGYISPAKRISLDYILFFLWDSWTQRNNYHHDTKSLLFLSDIKCPFKNVEPRCQCSSRQWIIGRRPVTSGRCDPVPRGLMCSMTSWDWISLPTHGTYISLEPTGDGTRRSCIFMNMFFYYYSEHKNIRLSTGGAQRFREGAELWPLYGGKLCFTQVLYKKNVYMIVNYPSIFMT